MLVFTYVFFSKQLSHEKKQNESEIKNLKDSITTIISQNNDEFSLANNEYAQEYFIEKYDINKLMTTVKEALLAYNDDPKGNIYTGQEKLGEQKFIINKIKLLNHRWIIANYSDGQYWGDVLIKYFVEDDGKVTFKIMDSYIYPKEEY